MVSMSELRELAVSDEGTSEVERIVQHLVVARLLLLERSEDADSAGATVELLHESLIDSWPRLTRWLDENQEDAEFLAQLQSAARQWESSQRAEGLLWRGDAAHDADRWLERWRARAEAGRLSKREERYLEAVVALAHRARFRRKQLTLAAFAALAAVAVVVSLLALRSEQQAARAEREAARADQATELARRDALAARNATRVAAAREMQSDPTKVLALLREVEPGASPRGWSSLSRWALHAGLADRVLEHKALMGSVAFSPDSRQIVTAGGDSLVRVWAVAGDGDPLELRGHEEGGLNAAFSPDGQWINSASADHTALVSRADGSGEPVPLLGHEDRVPAARFSPDGGRIATASEDRTVRVWRARGDPSPVVLRRHEGEIFTAEFSPDGTRVLSASFDETARIWRADGRRSARIFRVGGVRLFSASFSPDGERILTVGAPARSRRLDLLDDLQPRRAIDRHDVGRQEHAHLADHGGH